MRSQPSSGLSRLIVGGMMPSCKDLIAKSPSASEGGASIIVKNLAKLNPKFAELVPKLMPFIGWIAAAFEAKGLYDEVSEYGLDGKTLCDAAALISTACSFIPPLTPLAVPISLAIHVGCFFVQHDPKKQKLSPGKTLTTEQVQQAANTASFASLDPSDQKIIQNLYAQYKDNTSELSTQVNQAKNTDQFKDPLNSLGVVYKAIHIDPNAIPPLAPTTNTGNLAPTSFNYSKFLRV